MVFQCMLLSGGLIKIIALLYAADKVCSLLRTSFGLSAPYLSYVPWKMTELRPLEDDCARNACEIN